VASGAVIASASALLTGSSQIQAIVLIPEIFSSTFSVYADYYAHIAQSGLKCSKSLFRAIDYIKRIDMLTFDVFSDAQSARDDLIFGIQSSYNTIFTNVYQIGSMENAFVALSKYVINFSKYDSVDAFITAFGIKVLPTYASLSTIFGQPINPDNLKNP
jgi:hypothetical protein